jgi:hypothetical protein
VGQRQLFCLARALLQVGGCGGSSWACVWNAGLQLLIPLHLFQALSLGRPFGGSPLLPASHPRVQSCVVCFLQDAAVLALDEATSNVDGATDSLIQQAMRECTRYGDRRRTLLVIAHRIGGWMGVWVCAWAVW